MNKPNHVVVIGAGIVGLATADALLSRGYRVTVLQKEPLSGDGCSFGNGGLIVPSHFEPLAAPGMIGLGIRMLANPQSPFGFSHLASFEVLAWCARFMKAATAAHVERCAPVLRDMNLGSRQIYESTFASLLSQAGYEHRGELMVCRTEKGLEGEKHLAEKATKLGLKTRVLDRSELRDFEPEFEIDAAGAVYFEDDAHLTPASFMAALRERVVAAGACVLDGHEVVEFKVSGRKIQSVSLAGEPMEADEFVLAAGAWTGQLARLIQLKLPLLAGKGYGFTVKNPPGSPKYPGILTEGRIAVTPMKDGLRFVGTMELGIPDDLSVNKSRVEGMRRSIPEYYPAFRGFDFETAQVWCGLRPCPPDGMPYVGRTSRYDNLVIATGHGMMGMSLGPVTGKLVGEIISGESPSVDIQLLSPDRYA